MSSESKNARLVEESLPSSGDVAVQATSVSKCYQLYDKPQHRLKQAIFPHFQRLLGMPVKTHSREFWALKDVTFELKKGQTVGIIGRNGSGKSTLLQIIAGTLEPTYGKAEVNGRVAALLELGSGFNPEFTGRENVYMNATILGLTREEVDARFDDIVSFAEIGEFIEQPVKTYSSGMYVRLAFAVQVAIEPDVLIIDEALSVGDARFSMKCLRRMRELVQRGTSCLFVSHDMSSVVNFCSQVIWLESGMIFQQGDPKEITLNYANFVSYGFLPPEKKSHEYSQVGRRGEDGGTIDAGDKKFAKADTSFFQNVHWIDTSNMPSTGVGGARITRIALYAADNPTSVLLSGGEDVQILIEIDSRSELTFPVVCADFRDKKGNLIFGLNTMFVLGQLPCFKENTRHIISFKFSFPLLLNGNYSVSTALADGSLHNHVQHHIIHDAVIVEVRSSVLSRNYYLTSLEHVECSVLC